MMLSRWNESFIFSLFKGKMMKIVNIDEENLHIFRPNDWRNFNEIFKKNLSYDIKSHKKQGFNLSRK